MAVLDSTARARVYAAFMRENTETSSFSKAELAAAVAAVDDWVEANQSSFNTALPTGFRTKASTAQKTFLFAFVLMRRIGRLRTDEDG